MPSLQALVQLAKIALLDDSKKSKYLVLYRVVSDYAVAGPGLDAGPWGVGLGPEWVVGREAEGEEGRGTMVEAAGVDIFLGHFGLIAGKSDGEPALGIEVCRVFKLTLNDCCEG